MFTQTSPNICFNCKRTDHDIPIIQWNYQQKPLRVCSECMPQLIHRWQQIAGRLTHYQEAEDE